SPPSGSPRRTGRDPSRRFTSAASSETRRSVSVQRRDSTALTHAKSATATARSPPIRPAIHFQAGTRRVAEVMVDGSLPAHDVQFPLDSLRGSADNPPPIYDDSRRNPRALPGLLQEARPYGLSFRLARSLERPLAPLHGSGHEPVQGHVPR